MARTREHGFSSTNLARARELSRKSQEMVASELGVKQTQYSRYERGENEPNSSTLKRLARVLGVSTDFLLGITDTPVR